MDIVQTLKIVVVKYCLRCRTIIRIGRIRFRVFLNTKSLLLIDSVIGIYLVVKLRQKINSVVKAFSEFLNGSNDNYTCLSGQMGVVPLKKSRTRNQYFHQKSQFIDIVR